jgi:hypothetical protein
LHMKQLGLRLYTQLCPIVVEDLAALICSRYSIGRDLFQLGPTNDELPLQRYWRLVDRRHPAFSTPFERRHSKPDEN